MYNIHVKDNTGDTQIWLADNADFKDGFIVMTNAALKIRPSLKFVVAAIKSDNVVCVLVQDKEYSST